MGKFIIKGRITGWRYEIEGAPKNWILKRFYLVPDQDFTVTYADKKYAIFIDSNNGNNAKQICFKEKLIIKSHLPDLLNKMDIVTLEFSTTGQAIKIKSDDSDAELDLQISKIVFGE